MNKSTVTNDIAPLKYIIHTLTLSLTLMLFFFIKTTIPHVSLFYHQSALNG